MPAKKRPRKDSVPCVAGSGFPDARFAWRGGDTRAAPRMLRQAVRNLDDRFRLVIFWSSNRKPAVRKQIDAIGRGQGESRSVAHSRLAIITLAGHFAAPNCHLFCCGNWQTILLLCGPPGAIVKASFPTQRP
jgi:hypothetical protein